MPKKKTIVLRLEPEMLAAVQKWAADEFRSTNGQLEWIISRALKDAGRDYRKKGGTPTEAGAEQNPDDTSE